MNMRALTASLLGLCFVALTAGCTRVEGTSTWTGMRPPIDGLNRDVTATQGGAVHDPTTLSPPPVRREYATDR